MEGEREGERESNDSPHLERDDLAVGIRTGLGSCGGGAHASGA